MALPGTMGVDDDGWDAHKNCRVCGKEARVSTDKKRLSSPAWRRPHGVEINKPDSRWAHFGCNAQMRSGASKYLRGELVAPIAKRQTRSHGLESEPEPARPAQGGWSAQAAPANALSGSHWAAPQKSRRPQPEPPDKSPECAPPPPRCAEGKPSDEAPRSKADDRKQRDGGASSSSHAEHAESAAAPHHKGGAVVGALYAALREAAGKQQRKGPLSPEDRVAVGARVAWTHYSHEEAVQRGKAEASARGSLAKDAIVQRLKVAKKDKRIEQLEQQLKALQDAEKERLKAARADKARRRRPAASPASAASTARAREPCHRERAAAPPCCHPSHPAHVASFLPSPRRRPSSA